MQLHSAAKQPRPANGSECLFIPFEPAELVSNESGRALVPAQCWRAPRRFLGGRVDDLGEQAVALIERYLKMRENLGYSSLIQFYFQKAKDDFEEIMKRIGWS